MIFASISIPSNPIDENQEHSVEIRQDILVEDELIEDSWNENFVDNTYVVDDLLTFDKNEMVESDIIAYDSDGNEFLGVVLIQNFKGIGQLSNIEDEKFQVQLIFLENGTIEVESDIDSPLKVEVLNFRIIDVDVM